VYILLLIGIALSVDKQVEVVDFFVKVYIAPNTNSKYLGLAQKSERYSILMANGSWLKIDFKGTSGWVEASKVQHYNPATATPATPAQTGNQDIATSTEDPGKQTISRPSVQSSQQIPKDTQPSYTNKEATKASNQYSNANYQEVKGAEPVQSEPKKSNKEPSQTQPTEKPSIKKWFTRTSLSKIPIIEQNFEEKQTDKYFLITNSSTKILLTLSPDSPILGLANRGEKLKLIGEGESWCKVIYKDTTGWVLKKNGKTIKNNQSNFNQKTILIIVSSILILILLVVILLQLFKVNNKRKKKSSIATIKKNALVVCKEVKAVHSTLSDSQMSLEDCFSEIGYEVNSFKDLIQLKQLLAGYTPDILLVDYQFDRSILPIIDKLLTAKTGIESLIYIVYNIPDPENFETNYTNYKITPMGYSFSDRDIYKIVSPPHFSPEGSQQYTKGMQSSALEGELGGGNIIEVLQFIEIGRKTGCLLVEFQQPLGLIYLDRGRINYAASADGLTGRDAVFYILNLKEGKFRFIIDKKPKTSNTSLSTLEILMEWTKSIDEAHRD
jgi:uncharacterized protein YraI